LTTQIIKLSHSDVFKRYSSKYDIFRDLYEIDLIGLELKNCESMIAEQIKREILASKEICYSVASKKNGGTDILILGTISIFGELSRRIVASRNEDIGYKISQTISNYKNYDSGSFNIGDKSFSLKSAIVMGILNVTPDSFSDGGKYCERDLALKHSESLIEDGADIIDIGGESSRPGANSVETSEEIKRVLPIIKVLNKEFPNVILSIDTTKSEVAKAALDNGVTLVNDISGLINDPEMIKTVKACSAALVIMHMKGTPQSMQVDPQYDDLVGEVYEFLNNQCQLATYSGIKNIIVDPGIGFGKRVIDNYEILNRLQEFKGLGLPILVGLSRKSFIGKVFKNEINEREDLSLAAETFAMANGARIIRTHKVKNTVDASKLINFIENPGIITSV